MLGTQVSGKTLGLVGMGRIARAVAKRAHDGFGMKRHLPRPLPAAARDRARHSGAEQRERLEHVLREADFVSLHCPATPETRHLMNRETAGPDAAGRVPDQHRARGCGGRGGADRGAQGAAHRRRGPRRVRAGAAGHGRRCSPWRTSFCSRISAAPRRETRVAMGMRALENLRLFFTGSAPPRPCGVTVVALEPFSAAAPPGVARSGRGECRRTTPPKSSSSCRELLLVWFASAGRPSVEPVLRGERGRPS